MAVRDVAGVLFGSLAVLAPWVVLTCCTTSTKGKPTTMRAALADEPATVWEGPELRPTTRWDRPPMQATRADAVAFNAPPPSVPGLPLGQARTRGTNGRGADGTAEAMLRGCAGSPRIGRAWTFTVGATLRSALPETRRYVMGLVVTAARLPVAVDLAVIGAPGNTMLLDPGAGIALTFPMGDGASGAGMVELVREGGCVQVTVTLPVVSAWVGAPLWLQSWAMVPGSNAIGLVLGNAVEVRIG